MPLVIQHNVFLFLDTHNNVGQQMIGISGKWDGNYYVNFVKVSDEIIGWNYVPTQDKKPKDENSFLVKRLKSETNVYYVIII